jgi:hypothetical protein
MVNFISLLAPLHAPVRFTDLFAEFIVGLTQHLMCTQAPLAIESLPTT